MTNAQKEWIDSRTYEELLARWRFAAVGDPMFQGEAGEYYAKVMFTKRDQLPASEAVAASKRIGWEQ